MADMTPAELLRLADKIEECQCENYPLRIVDPLDSAAIVAALREKAARELGMCSPCVVRGDHGAHGVTVAVKFRELAVTGERCYSLIPPDAHYCRCTVKVLAAQQPAAADAAPSEEE